MSCCPITGLTMVELVVAADGHTYKQHAMTRWLRTSNHSPLTGEMLAHSELVPNYLILSSLGNNDKVESERVLDSEYVKVVDTYEYLQVSVQYCTEESGTTDLMIDELR